MPLQHGSGQAKTCYAIALGSNRRSRHGSPTATLHAALEALDVDAASAIRHTAALGPAGRSFANAVAIISTHEEPPELLARLKQMERAFGRRGGRKWGPRVLDLDVVLWSGGTWSGPGPTIPHPEFGKRRFVLQPLAEVAADWRDPVSGATVGQLLHRLVQPRPVDRVPTRT